MSFLGPVRSSSTVSHGGDEAARPALLPDASRVSGVCDGSLTFDGASQALLRSDIRDAWTRCRDAVAQGDKQAVRDLHLHAKRVDETASYSELRRSFERHRSFFPHPARINPERISPIVIPVRPRTLEERLFKLARGYWSMPYSKGYGRRLRFVVVDEAHEALIGIIGLQSPSADLACRDRYFGVPRDLKLSVVNNTLDAYTVGATPSYAPLLAGKLIAGFLCSKRIRQEYWRTYGSAVTTQLKKPIPQPLLAITTASAFGRSSIYNRLKDQHGWLARSLGYTQGYGTMHLEELYPRMVEYLRSQGRHVPAGFGNGPKVRWQNITNTLLGLGLPTKYLSHGVKREVFLFSLVTNLLDVCRTGAVPAPIEFDDCAWASHWLERWCLPRVARQPDWYEIPAPNYLRAALER